MPPSSGSDAASGLLPSVRRVLATLAEMAQSRIELAGIELGEAAERLVSHLLSALLVVLLLGGALIAFSALVVLAAPEAWRLPVLGAMGALYLVGALMLLARLRAALREAPPVLAGTLEELRNDLRMLRGAAPGGPEAPSR